MKPARRTVLGALLATVAAAAGQVAGASRRRVGGALLRPPGAVAEDAFKARCTRCFQCGEICPNGCIQFHGLDQGLDDAFTPYIRPREQACTACMKCTQVCPTGALTPTDADPEVVMAEVKMGLARLNREMCYSWAEPARTCGVCYRACPFPGEAMTIGLFERPVVHRDKCIGCGLCEQSCVHLPQAIRVLPVERS